FFLFLFEQIFALLQQRINRPFGNQVGVFLVGFFLLDLVGQLGGFLFEFFVEFGFVLGLFVLAGHTFFGRLTVHGDFEIIIFVAGFFADLHAVSQVVKRLDGRGDGLIQTGLVRFGVGLG